MNVRKIYYLKILPEGEGMARELRKKETRREGRMSTQVIDGFNKFVDEII